jgi:hypothetical protein
MIQPNPDRSDEDLPEPPQVRRLRRLVSLLMLVMISAMVVVAVTMVIRLGNLGSAGEGASTVGPVDAQRFNLPAGAEVVAVGQGAGGVLLVTRDASGAEMLRVMDPASGAQISATPIIRE